MGEEPELRAGPPWAMEEMILREPEIAPHLLARSETAHARALIRVALDGGEPVVLVGCGTSEHAAMAGAAILTESLGGLPVIARDAFEASLDPQTGGVLVAISHEGETPATRSALGAAARRGARTILITAMPERAPEVTLVVPTPLRDRSWCHTVGYFSPLLAVYAMTGPPAGPVLDIVAAALAQRPRHRQGAAALAPCERLVVAAGGADEITARELALKIEEGVHVPVTPLGVEKILHGHLPAADPRTGLIVLRFDARDAQVRDARADDVRAAARALDLPTVTVDLSAEDLRTVTRDLSAECAPPVAGALIAGAIAAQLLTLELVLARGTNPDLIRREDPRYRAAAEAGEGGYADLG